MRKRSRLGSFLGKKEESKLSSKEQEHSKTSPPFALYAMGNPTNYKIRVEINFLGKLTTAMVFERKKASQLTCGWLLEETRRNLMKADLAGRYSPEISKIIALSTAPRSIALDYWLTLPEKDLSILPYKIQLEPVIAQESRKNIDKGPNTKPNKNYLKEFEIYGLLGQGAFAKVYLGNVKHQQLRLTQLIS